MINFIVNNASYLIGGAIVLFSVIGIFALSKESKKLSQKPATTKTDKKEEKTQKSAEKSAEKTADKSDKPAYSTEKTTKTTEKSTTEKATTEKAQATEEPSKAEKGKTQKKSKGSKVEKLIDTRPRYARETPKTIEESESNERIQHISQIKKDIHCFDKKKHKQFSKSKPYTYVSTNRKGDMPKYMVTPEEKALYERMNFVKNRKGTVAKLAKRDKMLKMPSPTIPEPVIAPEPKKEEKAPELTAEEKRQLKYAKYFDKSRRISRSINEGDMDSLFDSHLSDAYMDIDINRHLRIGKKFDKSLYSMASKVLAHGEIKILDDADLTIKANRKAWLKQKSKEENKRMRHEGREYEDFLDEELKRDEAIDDYIYDNYNDDLDGEHIQVNMNLSPKNMLMVDSVINRDRGRRRSGRLGRK